MAASGEAQFHDLPLGRGVRVCASHPCGLVALDKPEGIMTVPNAASDFPKALLRAKFDKKKEGYFWPGSDGVMREFHICHRLDSPTSGVVVGALHADLAVRVREQFKLKKVEKWYLAAVDGLPRQPYGVWKDRLSTRQEGAQVRTQVKSSGEWAETRWRKVAEQRRHRLSLLELKPVSGRTHQLRVQSSSRLMPIVGDKTYGNFKLNARLKRELGIKRMLLHALRVQLSVQWSGVDVRFTALSPVPEGLVQLFDIKTELGSL